MKLSALREAADRYGDVVSAYVDVSRTGAQGAQEVELRCRSAAEEALAEGADPAVVDAVSERLMEPTGLGGTTSRVVVAHGKDVVVDAVLGVEVRSHGHHGPIAHLTPLARVVAEDVRHALVLVDHTGADITLVDTVGATTELIESEGDHDVLHKVRGGGLSHRRFQSRVEDSWDRNADQVARDLDSIVTRENPEIVLLAGDDYACSRVAEAVGGKVAERLQRIEHGSRAEGASDERLDQEVEAARQRRRTDRIDAVLERLGAAEDRKAVGVADTVEALRRGEVVRELNRLGVLVDVSHASDEAFWDALETTRAPVLASHSSARALADSPRNLTDDMLRAIGANGGVAMVNFGSMFVDPRKTTRAAVGRLLVLHPFDHGTPLSFLADHVEHVAQVAGEDHVGLGSDFDGVPFLPEGMEDVGGLPELTVLLARRGWSEARLRKLLGENVLRAMEAAERVAAASR